MAVAGFKTAAYALTKKIYHSWIVFELHAVLWGDIIREICQKFKILLIFLFFIVLISNFLAGNQFCKTNEAIRFDLSFVVFEIWKSIYIGSITVSLFYIYIKIDIISKFLFYLCTKFQISKKFDNNLIDF